MLADSPGKWRSLGVWPSNIRPRDEYYLVTLLKIPEGSDRAAELPNRRQEADIPLKKKR
jgi:hypothetical protein